MQKRKAERQKMRKRHKVALLTAVMLTAALAVQPVLAAETTGYATLEEALAAGCSIEVTAPPALEKPEQVSLDIYKVAAANKLEGFDAYDFVWETAFAGAETQWEESQADDEVTTQEIDALAQTLAGIVLENIPEYQPRAEAEAGTLPDGVTPIQAAFNEEHTVDPGLYLILARGTDQNNYKIVSGTEGTLSTGMADEAEDKLYQFAPMLVSVPQRGLTESETGEILDPAGEALEPEYTIGLGNTAGEGDWQSNITINAKMAVSDLRLGSLKITKTLTNHEAVQFGDRFDQTTVLLSVNVKMGEKTVYDQLIPMVFSAAGTQEKIISGLPIGAAVIVEEVYAGNNYQIDGDPVWSSKTHTIVAGDPDAEDAEILTVSFTNSHDGSWTGGGAAINTFSGTIESIDGSDYTKWEKGSQQFSGETANAGRPAAE